MKLKNKNIKALFASLLFAAFVVSFTHAFLEQIENGCAQHENHDFSIVIVNAAPVKSHIEKSSLNNLKISNPALQIELTILSDIHNLKSCYLNDPPSIFSDKIYLNISGALLI